MTFRVIQVRDGPSSNPTRIGLTDRIVTYITDRPGAIPDTVHLPAETYTDDALVEAVKAREAQKGDLQGKSFQA